MLEFSGETYIIGTVEKGLVTVHGQSVIVKVVAC